MKMKKTSFCVAGMIILSLFLVNISVGHDASSTPETEAGIEDEQDEFPLVNRSNTAWVLDQGSDALGSVSGNHYEMGYQHGAMVPEETEQTMRAYLDYVDEDVEELLEVYEKGEPYISDEYKREMEGLSDGASVELDEVKAVHSIPTLYHCSGFGVSGEGTTDGGVYHTRSLDYGIDIVDDESGRTMQMNALTLFRDPDEGYGSAVPAWSGFVGSVDGMNEEKISIGEMGQSTDDSSKEGNFMIFRIRDTLEKASNMDEAVSHMKPNRTYGFGFVVADGESNTSQMIEMSHSEYYNGTWDDRQEDNSPQYFQMNDTIRRGNRYAAYQTALTQRDNFMIMPTDGGFMHLMNYLEHSKRLEREYGDIDFDTAEDIYVEAHRSYPLQMTLHQAVFSPSEQKIRRANAYPDGTGAFWNEFHEYSFPMVESQPDLLTLSSPTNGSSVSGDVDVIPDYEYTPERMELYINGVKEDEKTSEPFKFTWDSSTVSEGNHVVEVRAYGHNHSAVAYNTVSVEEETKNNASETFQIEHESVIRDDSGSDQQPLSDLDETDMLRNLHVPTPNSDITSSEDDWIIDETVYLNDTTEEIIGNVLIQENGSLMMSNSTLVINSSYDHEFGLFVTDEGSLILQDSTITNLDHQIYCQADDTADEIKIIDSKVEGGGGTMDRPLFTVATSNTNVEGSTFIHSSFGFMATGDTQGITVSDTEFILEEVVREPVDDIFSPRGASLLMNDVQDSTVENITVFGEHTEKLLSFGILLSNSQGISIDEVYVENEFGGVGLLAAGNNDLKNITVTDSHAGIVALLGSQQNFIENIYIEHTNIGLGNMESSPDNTFRDIYLNDTTMALAAEGDSDGMKVENAEIKNSRGGGLFDGSSDLILRNITLEADYAGLVFGDGSHDSEAENITMDLGREFLEETMEFPAVAIDGSDNIKLHDIEVSGTRHALDVQGDDSSNFELDVSDFKTEEGEVVYQSGSVPEEVTGDQVFLHDLQDTEVDVETGDGPVYLTHAENVTLNATVIDAVSGIIVDQSNDVTITGEVVDSYSHGVKIDNSHQINVDVDVTSAYWGYSIKNSEDVKVEGETDDIKDAMVYAHTTSDTEFDVQASESAYGIVAGYSTLEIVGSLPPLTQELKLHESTITLTETDYIEIEPKEKTVGAGNVVNYTATAYDELGQEIGEVTEGTEWSIEDGAGGEWDQDTGVYTTENEGEWTVTANYTENGREHSDSATLLVEPVYELTINEPVGEGTVEVDGQEVIEWPYEETYDEDTEVELNAMPKDGWSFGEWTGTEKTGEEITLLMDEDKEVTAVFEEDIEMYDLTVDIEGEGDVDIDPDQDEYEKGTDVTLTATPDENWSFEGWTGDYTGTEEEITITMDEDKMITAHFEEEVEMYDLTVDIEGEGDVDIDPDQDEYEEGTNVTLTAIPDENWSFEGWTGDYEGTEEEITITMDEDKEVTAVFEEDIEMYDLTVDIEGEGTIEIDPDQDEYEEGTNVTLTAIPDENWSFEGWTGDYKGTEEEITITMDEDKTITAHFEEEVEEYSLTIYIDGEGSTDPEVGTHRYEADETVTITAIPADGWDFEAWTGDVPEDQAEETTIEIEMNRDKEIVAIFFEERVLTINIDGSGSVRVDNQQVEDGWTGEYEHGTSVSLYAVADEGWEFVEWTGSHTGSEDFMTINMNADKEMTAVFEPDAPIYDLTINVEGQGTTDPEEGTHDYIEDTNVTITATAAEDWYFEEWTGDHEATEEEINITMDEDKEITAHFAEEVERYELTVSIEGDGEVDVYPDEEEYEEGTNVTLTAIPEEGWSFEEWTGDHESEDENITITMDEDKSVIARFEEEEEEDDEVIAGMSLLMLIGLIVIVLIILVALGYMMAGKGGKEEGSSTEDETGIMEEEDLDTEEDLEEPFDEIDRDDVDEDEVFEEEM